jgi:sec-independent protein translocase protein TatB
MFDVGFSEIVVIGVVALIVVGPERLPKVARTVGHLFGRMQRYVNDVKADISREMELEELRKLQTDMQDATRSFESTVRKELSDTEQAIQQSIAPPTETAAETVAAPSEAALIAQETSTPIETAPVMPDATASLPDAAVKLPEATAVHVSAAEAPAAATPPAETPASETPTPARQP